MADRSGTLRVAVLFAAFYFAQGIAEPTEGLITQPIASLLRRWGASPAEITSYAALLALPWSIKPLYGLLSDHVPLFRRRRVSYLVMTGVASGLGLLLTALLPMDPASRHVLQVLLVFPAVGVAFGDVVIDALMVEHGQPRGLTGMLQSVQWAAAYGATILTGFVGGWLSQHGLHAVAFALCGITMLGVSGLALIAVREPPTERPRSTVGETLRALFDAARSPLVLAAAAFIVLWHFNPFTSTLLYTYSTEELGITETQYGATVSAQAVGSVVGCALYFFGSRHLSTRALLYISVALGVSATLAYWGFAGPTSGLIVQTLAGVALMSGTLVTLEAAARTCPLSHAATVFALIMAALNLSAAAATWVGGHAYEAFTSLADAHLAFDALVGIGAACTATSLVVIPTLVRQLEPASSS